MSYDTKRCSTCKKPKPIADFYRQRDGHRSECKVCVKIRTVQWQRANAQRHVRNTTAWRKAHPEIYRKATARKKRAEPERNRARVAVARAIQVGAMIRPQACDQCKTDCKPDAHHEDYVRWWDVRWLCAKCHSRHHQGLAAAAR